ncbi:hypothetical protein Bca52824_006373 [Brassica carinata]|uniref:Methyltransferase n=1 Tax=Brassica carinata TaxID=52824 RepID=A0A8X7WQI2_BRACI|nr:hypothetical protein Bca52824_006373 [Brassica carinata]
MKHPRSERVRAAPKLFTYVLVGFIALLGLTCLYYGSSFAPGSRKSDDEFDGSNTAPAGFARDRDGVSRLEICDSKHSDLIPCLDRDLHHQLKLRLNLTLMEHYEHHCPPPERRFNCLVPPPAGYKIPIKWPVSRDEVWKANIPHTHLAQEKSDQNWMVVNGDKINFPGGGTHFHYGADKYIVSLAQELSIRCRIDWLQRDGILLLELDRLLRPGGYFVYSSPEAYAHDPENRKIGNAMHDLFRRMCWRVVAKRDQSVIWGKPISNSCYLKRGPGVQPPLCPSGDDPDATWNVSMKACITPYSVSKKMEWACSLATETDSSPPRLEEVGVTPEQFREDTETWRHRVMEYWKLLKPMVQKNSIRNVMDMSSNLGGFAAALNDKDVWVMNVIPVQSSPRMKIIYDRGLIGATHDWCEAFDTYPRTFDLLHAWNTFTETEARGCSIEDLLIEIDRILRPEGFVIIRDTSENISYIKKYLTLLKWDKWMTETTPKVTLCRPKTREF